MTMFLVGVAVGAPVGALAVAYAWLRSDGSSVRRPGYVELTGMRRDPRDVPVNQGGDRMDTWGDL